MLYELATLATDTTGTDLAWTITALGLGLVLWAAGGGLMRPAVGALGLAAGAIAGRMVWLETGIGPEWVLPLVGALATTCVALLAWRLASGMLLCLLGALLAGSVTWGIASFNHQANVPAPPLALLFGITQPTYTLESTPPESDPPAVVASQDPSPLDTAALVSSNLKAKAQAIGGDIAQSEAAAPIRAAWMGAHAEIRFSVLIAMGIAALVGLLIAALTERTAAIWLTAIGGALLVVAALPRLGSTLGAGELGITPTTSVHIAIGAWLAMTVLGIVIQMAMATPPPRPAAQ
jgi:hypothetical protein